MQMPDSTCRPPEHKADRKRGCLCAVRSWKQGIVEEKLGLRKRTKKDPREPLWLSSLKQRLLLLICGRRYVNSTHNFIVHYSPT